ncbi:WD repeat-containing protein [Sparassis crispa]|uniref:WD repeat-containing protein n=1 Tax=Sparassis crispa TaxID=139825 RepID=A0A401GN56_9APHY|nr:WD repeat-containing protein [Sparassis crispa]GBE83646.1 WD repeat-containing protein [Sparassis crispa]
MSHNPKTPSNSRYRSRSEAKMPLTPSLTAGLNSLSLAPSSTKSRSDLSMANPFLLSRPGSPTMRGTSGSTSASTSKGKSKSRPASPIKRQTSGALQVSESLHRQASTGVLRKGGVESKLDVITHDYVPPKSEKRSKSQPSRDTRDRFITVRDPTDEVAATLDLMSLNPQSASPGHTARLAAATGVPLNRRVLSYHEPPPASSSDPLLAQAREFARPLYARPGALPNSTSSTTSKGRKIATQPERVLDAPGMVDDFYLNLVAWSSLNILAVALAENTYIWRADSGEVVHLGEAPEATYVAAVDFSNDGQFLGVGLGSGAVELWDVETQTKLRTMAGHASQVACLSWYEHLLTSGCGDGSIWHHDVRVARHKVGELMGHQGEVCGLKWRSDGELLASGGNDNVVNVWDGRVGDVSPGTRSAARWTKRNHTAAVKAVAWCPWQPSLLASGGGTSDATVHIWNTTTGARLHSLVTPSQVTSIQWSPHKKEFLTTHGYPTNALMVHSYPSMERVVEIRDAHDSRVLWSALGPAGDMVCTGAGDENLKFWRIWDVPRVKKGKEAKDTGRTSSTRSGILSIR